MLMFLQCMESSVHNGGGKIDPPLATLAETEIQLVTTFTNGSKIIQCSIKLLSRPRFLMMRRCLKVLGSELPKPSKETLLLPIREFITLMSHLICTLEIDLIKVQNTAQLRVGLEHILALLQGVLFEILHK